MRHAIEHKPTLCSIEQVNRNKKMPGKGIFGGKVKRLTFSLFIYKAGHSTARLAVLELSFGIAYVTRCNNCLTLCSIMRDTSNCELKAINEAKTDTSIGPNHRLIGRGVNTFISNYSFRTG